MDADDRAAIVVIADNADFSYLMRRYVSKTAYRTVCARIGPDAVALARGVRPVAIVLEGDPPGARCWRVLRALKAEADTRHIPVLLCSWLDVEERSFDEGVDVYLRKPILYEDFVAALMNMGVHPRP